MALFDVANLRNLFASRPSDNSALKAGRLFFQSDGPRPIFRDNGTTWDDVTPLPYQLSYATQALRLAATGFVAADVGKIALVVADGSLWMLTATTPTWQMLGSRVKISDTLVGVGGVANVNITGIPAAFRNLTLEVVGRTNNAANPFDGVRVQFNGDTANNYDWTTIFVTGTGSTGGTGAVTTNAIQLGSIAGNSGTAGRAGHVEGRIYDYLSTTWAKTVKCEGGRGETAQAVSDRGTGQWRSLTAITSILVFPQTGTLFLAGTRVILYGEI
ncbi:MAG TPA: hypothetical protein VF914_05505 [Chloroflexia bacterium]|jgi:hypothetical protein